MFIQTEATADPAVLKFLPGQPVLGQGTLRFDDESQAAISPLAQRLFGIAGVAAVGLGPDHIAVTKAAGEWQHLKPAILGAIMEHVLSGAPIVLDRRPAERGAAGTDGALAAVIRDALRRVIDPELGYNIVDLGLVYDVAVAGGRARVTMTTTTPGCPATAYLRQGAGDCAANVEGVAAAEVALTYDPRWSPEMMSPEAKAHFGIG
ncbi:MAG TPA: NifU N-terminal domain-containing protein [Hyphomicrobiales bacterium]|nr:NifU N-terminal domain-containing protein [Hyphomicrobiales bacterium]